MVVDSKADSLNFRVVCDPLNPTTLYYHVNYMYKLFMPTNLCKFYLVRIINPINKQKLLSWPGQVGKQKTKGQTISHKTALVSAQEQNYSDFHF